MLQQSNNSLRPPVSASRTPRVRGPQFGKHCCRHCHSVFSTLPIVIQFDDILLICRPSTCGCVYASYACVLECMHVCVYVCVSQCVCLCMAICECLYVCLCVCLCESMYLIVCGCMCLCVCVSVCLCVCACVSVCICLSVSDA